MHKQQALAQINATLLAKGFSEKSGIVPEYEGHIRVHGKSVSVAIAIPDTSFSSLPIVKLKDKGQLSPAIVGHLSGQGADDTTICYASQVGLPLDLTNPGGSILRVLEEAAKALEISYNNRGIAEVTNEYQDYWRDGLLSFRIFASRTPPSSKPLRLGYFRMEQGIGEPFFGLHSDGKLNGHKCDKLADAMLIQASKPITPIGKIKVPFTLAHLKQWFLGQKEMDEAKWDAAFRLLSERGLLAISAPNCVLGVRLNFPLDLKVGQDTGKIRQAKIPDLLMSRQESVQLTRFGGYWCDLASLAERNLKGMTTFADKTIALVGCGTIGGYLAKFLAQSGAGASKPLFLIDRQMLSPGNIGRHFLGTAYIGMPKAEALRDELKRFHPDCDARAVSDELAACMDVVRSADLIVDASGEWNTQCALNGQFLEDQEIKAEAILHSWICGNGAAVQSFINLKGDDFCLRCMRPDPSTPSRYTALNPKTEAVIEEATCGDGAYFPYSVAAPSMAAGITLEMALGVINGKPGSRLRTIVLDHKRGIERKPTTPTAHKDCPSCKARAASD